MPLFGASLYRQMPVVRWLDCPWHNWGSRAMAGVCRRECLCGRPRIRCSSFLCTIPLLIESSENRIISVYFKKQWLIWKKCVVWDKDQSIVSRRRTMKWSQLPDSVWEPPHHSRRKFNNKLHVRLQQLVLEWVYREALSKRSHHDRRRTPYPEFLDWK
jgi:hypothetical protein